MASADPSPAEHLARLSRPGQPSRPSSLSDHRYPMDFGDLFDNAHDGAFFKIIGTKVQDKLRELRQSRPEENARRWGWELLQNAKDVAHPDQPVRVRFELDEGA